MQIPPQFIGMDLNTDDVLPLFPIPTVPVTPTVVVDPGNGQLTVSWNVPVMMATVRLKVSRFP